MDADGDASVAEAKAGASEDVEPGEQQRAPSSTNLQAVTNHVGAKGPAFDPAFAPPCPPFVFWQDAGTLLVLGALLGVFGYAYLKAVSEVTQQWLQAGRDVAFNTPPALQFGAGSGWWVALTCGAGLAVGLAKAAMGVDEFPSFIDELRAMEVHPLMSAKIAVCALLGLLGGLPMGPEAGLGASAGALGQLAATRARRMVVQAADRAHIYVVACMCAGFGSFLPAPLPAVLLTIELGRAPVKLPGVPSLHILTLLAVACTAAFVTYYAIAGYTYIDPTAIYSTTAILSYDQFDIVQGILFGVMGAALAYLFVLVGAVTKVVAAKLSTALEARLGKWARVVAMPTIGGAVYGGLGVAMPLVLTDGAAFLGPVIARGDEIGSDVLAASVFGKMLAWNVCQSFGFAGGIFLPMLSMSAMLGRVFVNQTGVNAAVAMGCSTIALAAALVPAPLFTSILAICVVELPPQALVPVFACSLTAYTLCLGMGGPQALMAAAARRKARAAAAAGGAH